MIVGVPKEIKVEEYRVAATPYAAAALVSAGHKVLIQSTAGDGAGFSDEEYSKVGATIVKTADEVWNQAEMIYHVKEPIPSEYKYFRKGLIFWGYLHLAAERELTLELMKTGVTAVAFETVETADGALPCLDPMSAVAGRLAGQMGAQYLGKKYKGMGKLMGGVPGTEPATVVVLGGGIVGTNAAQMALGLGARVIIITRNVLRLRYLSEVLPGRVETRVSNSYTIAEAVKEADVVVGGVLVKGGRAPIMVTEEMVKSMKPGSVIVDVAIDQGGCVETIRPTTHSDPIFIKHGVVHYAVTNMPGIVPRTSAIALCNATLPYALKMADLGYREAMKRDEALRKGMNVWDGKCTYQLVADAFDLENAPFQA